MKHSTITKQDLATLIGAWNASEKLCSLLEHLSGSSPDTTPGETTIGSIRAVDILIRSIIPLYRHPDCTSRTEEEERAVTRILADRITASDKKAEKLLAGESAEKTSLTLDDEILLVTVYEGIEELEAFCRAVTGDGGSDNGSILHELYRIEDIILISSPVNKLRPDGYPADDSPVWQILADDLSAENKARKLLGLE